MTITSKPSQLAIVPPSPATSFTYPPLPKTLPTAMDTEWRSMIDLMRAEGRWQPQKAALLETYFVNLNIIRQSATAMAEDGGACVDGKAHPASALIVRHSQALAKVAGLIGIATSVSAAVEAPAKGSAWTA